MKGLASILARDLQIRTTSDAAVNQPPYIIVAEDEADLAEVLVYNLSRAGYLARAFRDGPSAWVKIRESRPDAVILDRMLPGLTGDEIARRVRADPRTNSIPVLMLTAKSSEADQLTGFNLGADDYVTKPFSLKVVLARLESLLRRSSAPGHAESGADQLSHGPLAVDLATHRVTVGGDAIKLTLTEFNLLVALMRFRGRVVSRADLIQQVMGPSVIVTRRTIDVHIASLRKKLGDIGAAIQTERGVGYILSEPPPTPAS
ncbi:MAG: response regulator transcription factor [Phycisphaerae bacterium]|nr:response regulator transcription factor [Phycisphaerae bacterium]